jgi:hypothetical protein
MVDHVWECFEGDRTALLGATKTAFRAYLEGKCSNFKLVCDSANALKHYRVTTKPVIEGYNSIGEFPTVLQFHDAAGPFYVTDKAVFVDRDDGVRIDLGVALWGCVGMWSSELLRLGLTPSMPRMLANPFLTFDVPQDRSAVRFKLIGHVGEKHDSQFLCFRHDPTQNVLVPVDDTAPFDVLIHVDTDISESPFLLDKSA